MTASEAGFPEGGCTCGSVRYRMLDRPMFVHCCHCRWCQRETGAAFALNAMIEANRVELLAGDLEVVDTPTQSGAGQQISRCVNCRVAVWSNYRSMGTLVNFIRVGTLDHPDLFPPDVQIFTDSRQPWVVLAPGIPSFAEFYDRAAQWPEASLQRRSSVLEAMARG